MRRLPVGLAFIMALAALVTPGTAHARKQTDHRYHYEQVWSAAVRMVRVDLRYPIDDQDPNVGYVLFRYQDRGRAYPGSIELVRTEVEGVEYVRTVVQIPSMPSYVEQILLDRLDRKLRAEFGPPPERPTRPSRGEQDREDRDGDDEDEEEGEEDEDEARRDGDRRRNGRRSPRRGRRDS